MDIVESQRREERAESVVQGSGNVKLLVSIGMDKFDLMRVQQQAVAIEVLTEEIIMLSIAIGRIPDDRVKNVFHMTSYLVVAAC